MNTTAPTKPETTHQTLYPPPHRALWEITARCDLRCDHCLVDGGIKRNEELSTEQALNLIDQFADLGIRAVTLTGGEPFLRKDWHQLASRVRERQMILRFSANGHWLDAVTVNQLVALGTEQFAVSLDGLQRTHDWIRHGPQGVQSKSSFVRVIQAIERLRATPIRTTVITAVTPKNLGELGLLHQLLKHHRVNHWMVQLAHRTGRLTGNQFLALPPEQLPELADFLVSICDDPQLQPTVHNSIGYLSQQEPLLRSSGRLRKNLFWTGCRCGISSIGIEPDGGVKGCANQIGKPFVVGNVQYESLATIWHDRARWFWLRPSPKQMTGSCAQCPLAKVCQAGCTALSYSTSGEFFNNPYCLKRISSKVSQP